MGKRKRESALARKEANTVCGKADEQSNFSKKNAFDG